LLTILYSEPNLLTLEELSIMAGYSSSAVSAAMKILCGIKLVEKQRKLVQ
jgi:DNA-binding transcriptional regulator GbsR (MarR family)